MKEKVGEVFSIAKDNPPITGCTISKLVYNGINDITYFSLAKNTDISAKIYPYHKLLIVNDGGLNVYGTNGFCKTLNSGESVRILQERLKDAGFETIEENIRSQWNPEERDFIAVDNLVKNLLK